MNLPIHLFRLQSNPTERGSEIVHVANRSDIPAGKPIFRAPALTTLNLLNREVPFTVNYRPKLRDRL